MRNVGDGDGDDKAAAIVRVAIGLGKDRVVVILGVGRIDGDERDFAPVLPSGQIGGLRRFRFGKRCAAGRHAECRAHESRSG